MILKIRSNPITGIESEVRPAILAILRGKGWLIETRTVCDIFVIIGFMPNLSSDEKEIRALFEEALRLKDIARKSVKDINHYCQAAPLLERAAELSKKTAQNANIDEQDRFQHKVFAHYYSYEQQNCLGGYYYEKRQTNESMAHLKLADQEIAQAIKLVESIDTRLSNKIANHLRSFLLNWRHYRKHLHVQILANEARALWDHSRFIEALDIYRQMARYQREYLESDEFKQISSVYQRVAIGNYIGMMMNVSSAMAGAILQKTKVPGQENVSEIPFDLLTKLVRYTLDAYRRANDAFDQNPEWDQYRSVAIQCLRNIENFLRENPSARLPLSIAFEDDADFVKIMKLSDGMKEREHPMDQVKILFLSANPVGTTVLRLDEEKRSIKQKIRAADYRDQFQVETADAARPDDLLQAMNEHRPTIVHFSGHGSNADEIILSDNQGNPKPVSKDALVALFESTAKNVQIVVLNSCFSRPQAEAIVSVVPCAVGMKDTVSDEAAAVFSASFYRALAFGYSVKGAFLQGIAALKLEGIAEADIPELLTRSDLEAEKIYLVTIQKPDEHNSTNVSAQIASSVAQPLIEPWLNPPDHHARLDWYDLRVRVENAGELVLRDFDVEVTIPRRHTNPNDSSVLLQPDSEGDVRHYRLRDKPQPVFPGRTSPILMMLTMMVHWDEYTTPTADTVTVAVYANDRCVGKKNFAIDALLKQDRRDYIRSNHL